MIRFLAIVIGGYAVYSCWAGFRYEVLGYTLFGVAGGVTAIALWLRKPWSQYLMYTLGSLFVGNWLWIVLHVADPNESALESVISLIPGLLMVAFVIGSCWVVRMALSRERNPSLQPTRNPRG